MSTVLETVATVVGEEPVGEWIFTDEGDHAREMGPGTDIGCVIEDSVEAESSKTCSVVLLGDSTVACTYFPPANRPENHLLVRLRRVFPEQRFIVRNLAAPGEPLAELLRAGKLTHMKELLPDLHLAFVRYNLEEKDPRGVRGYLSSLQQLCEILRQQYPGITVILETGIWVNDTSHFTSDSQARLAPSYDQVRGWAMEAGFPVVDVFGKMQAEAAKGNRDLRVRGLPTLDQTVLDDSFDEFFGNEPAYFANIHPNSRCLGLIAEWEVAMIKNLARQA